jgi:hypothetical protein
LILARRQLLKGSIGLIAFPAIVRIESLMPVVRPDILTLAEWGRLNINKDTLYPIAEMLKQSNKLLANIDMEYTDAIQIPQASPHYGRGRSFSRLRQKGRD